MPSSIELDGEQGMNLVFLQLLLDPSTDDRGFLEPTSIDLRLHLGYGGLGTSDALFPSPSLSLGFGWVEVDMIHDRHILALDPHRALSPHAFQRFLVIQQGNVLGEGLLRNGQDQCPDGAVDLHARNVPLPVADDTPSITPQRHSPVQHQHCVCARMLGCPLIADLIEHAVIRHLPGIDTRSGRKAARQDANIIVDLRTVRSTVSAVALTPQLTLVTLEVAGTGILVQQRQVQAKLGHQHDQTIIEHRCLGGPIQIVQRTVGVLMTQLSRTQLQPDPQLVLAAALCAIVVQVQPQQSPQTMPQGTFARVSVKASLQSKQFYDGVMSHHSAIVGIFADFVVYLE